MDDLDAELEVETVVNKDDPDKTPAQKDTSTPDKGYPQLRGYFNVDNPTTQEKADLKSLWDYFAAEADNPADVLYKLKQMENRLAMPPLGQSRISYLANYIKVLNRVREADKEQERYLRS